MEIQIEKITYPKWKAVAEALVRNHGDTTKTAKELNLKRTYVYNVKFVLRKRGLMTGAKRDGYIATLTRESGLKLGRLIQRVRMYDVPFQRWLAEQTPEGGTVCDTLLSIAYDVYCEEKDNG